MMDECLLNQRDLGLMRRAPLESFWSQIRGTFGSLDTAGLADAKKARLSQPPEGEWVSEMDGEQILL